MTRRPLHIVHTEASCGWGGQEIRILTEAAGMIGRGHRVTLLCPRESTIFEAAPRYGVPVQALPIARKRIPGLLALRSWFRRHGHDIDIVNTHSSTDAWLVALAGKGLRGMPPVVRTRHVSSPINTRRSTFWLYQRAVQHLVVTGEPLRQQLVAHNHFNPSTMTSIPTGIDLTRFQPADRQAARAALDLPVDRRYIGILATLRDWKGHTYLFEALEQLAPRYPDLDLLVIGDGPYRDRLDLKLATLSIGERVRFVGHQDHPEHWLPAVDVFALPSYGDEGVSQAVMQAMACRLPVVTTPIGGMRDAVEHEVTGLFVPPRDAAALADALARLLDDVALRERLAEAAWQYAQQHFGRERMLDRMEGVFLKFARRGR